MIFARRRIQTALSQLDFGSDAQRRGFATRLNRRTADSLAAMWEVMILHSLARAGRVQHEQPTADGKNPDIVFASADLVFTADVSCVSDQGIRKRNPFDKLLNEIEHQKRALGLGIGGVYIDVGHSEDHLRVTLKLPPEEDIPGFVAEQVIPKIAQKLGEKE